MCFVSCPVSCAEPDILARYPRSESLPTYPPPVTNVPPPPLPPLHPTHPCSIPVCEFGGEGILEGEKKKRWGEEREKKLFLFLFFYALSRATLLAPLFSFSVDSSPPRRLSDSRQDVHTSAPTVPKICPPTLHPTHPWREKMPPLTPAHPN